MKRVITVILFAALLLTILLPVSATAADSDETVVRVGWFPYPSSSEIRNGKYYGYTYDYLMEIARYTDWKYEFVEADLATCCKMLATGDLDIIGGLQITDERDQIYDFSELPYSQTYLVMFTARDSLLESYDFAHYNDVKIGILKGTNNEENTAKFAEENDFTFQIFEYDTTEELHTALASGEIDAGVLLSYTPVEDTRIIAKFAPLPIHFVTTEGNKEVLSGLNRGMTLIRVNSPDFESRLYQKYYVSELSIDLSEEESTIVQASQEHPVVVGILDNSAPISFWNEDSGAYEGIIVDMLNAISEKTGLRFSFVSVDSYHWEAESLPNDISPKLMLSLNRTDEITDERSRYLSDSLHADTFSIVSRRGRNLFSEQDKKTVAVVTGFDVAIEYAKLVLPEFTISEYPNLQECLNAVAERKADAALDIHSCVSYLLQKPYYENLEVIPTYSGSIDACIDGFAKDSKTFIGIIDKGLQQVPLNKSRSIVLNYTVANPYEPTLQDTLYKYRGPLIIIVCLILFVIILFIALYLIKRKSDKQVKEALYKANQASAAKGNFMSRMSHEIRTPLNAVIGYNTIARNELTEAKTDTQRKACEMKVMDCLTKSDIASRHLLTIINDVLDISAIESGKIKIVNERFDFKGLISSLTAVFYSQAKSKGVDFNVQVETQMDEWIIGDQLRTNQILTNLLSNAVKFTNEGGKITLFIRPQTERNTVKLHFEVSDTGIGMAADYLDQIWMPFEQADSSISRRFGGTGLGLSITKTLVDLLGGDITVKSRPGEGSTFTVDLTFERTEQPENHGPYDFSTINALIVDDDVSTCDYIRLLLSRSGVRSSAVNSGQEALSAVRASLDENVPYTICLIDWHMPKMDGLDTVKQIRRIAGNDLPIIVITAYDFSEIVDKAAEMGINRFISKPLFQSSLFNLLANISGNPVPLDDEKFSTYDFSGARVLLVEDNAMNMEIACKIMESARLTVDKAWNGHEALDKFLSSPSGTYQAILMDVQMPMMDGYQATKAIRASVHPQAASIPIIAMTANAFSENIAESRAAGMNDHISKPIDLPSLFATLRQYIS